MEVEEAGPSTAAASQGSKGDLACAIGQTHSLQRVSSDARHVRSHPLWLMRVWEAPLVPSSGHHRSHLGTSLADCVCAQESAGP